VPTIGAAKGKGLAIAGRVERMECLLQEEHQSKNDIASQSQ
jgi:hypothetical protein